MVYAVIFAGGVGHRMGSDTPKQFLEINGIPILVHTIEKFASCRIINRIILVVLHDYMEYINNLVKKYKLEKVFDVVAGGGSALESQFLGLQKINDCYGIYNDDIVLIHDGVRPFINEDLINNCVKSVKEFGSAITVSPASETVGVVENKKQVKYTLPRQNCYILRAPQCFYLRDIYNAHSKAKEENKTYVDSASLMLDQGHTLNPVVGPIENIKITTQYDYMLAKLLLGDKK